MSYDLYDSNYIEAQIPDWVALARDHLYGIDSDYKEMLRNCTTLDEALEVFRQETYPTARIVERFLTLEKKRGVSLRDVDMWRYIRLGKEPGKIEYGDLVSLQDLENAIVI